MKSFVMMLKRNNIFELTKTIFYYKTKMVEILKDLNLVFSGLKKATHIKKK